MKTFFTLVIVTYIAYYAINIIYDLFIKKESKVNDAGLDEIVIAEENYAAQNISIDEVERVSPPDSFMINEMYSENGDEHVDLDLDFLEKKYEEEELLDNAFSENSANEIEEDGSDSTSKLRDQFEDGEDISINSPMKNNKNMSKEQFEDFLKLAKDISNDDIERVFSIDSNKRYYPAIAVNI